MANENKLIDQNYQYDQVDQLAWSIGPTRLTSVAYVTKLGGHHVNMTKQVDQYDLHDQYDQRDQAGKQEQLGHISYVGRPGKPSN